MNRLAFILHGTFVVALLILGWFGDRALTEQARAAEQRAVSEIDETSRRTTQAVRAALAQTEQALLTASPWPEVVMGRLAGPSPAKLPPDSFVPYLQRSEAALSDLLSSVNLTPAGLPEAVVAAIALGSPDARVQAAERMLAGRLPLRPEDIRYLSTLLEVSDDDRCVLLQEMLEAAPPASELPPAPDFRRRLTKGESIEGWSLNLEEIWVYAISGNLLLRVAGVSDHATISTGALPVDLKSNTRAVFVPDVDGLSLIVTPDVPGQLRIQTLRILLWAAVLASILGATVVLRALRAQTRALAHEKAFLANVTHELRTPLASIRLFGETLSEGRGDPQEYGSLVAQESQRLEALVERVLAATRVNERTSITRLDPVDLVQSTVSLTLERARKNSIDLRADSSLKAGSLPDVLWDADAVQQALLNLLDNAFKYGKPGGRIDVSVTVDDTWIRLSVTDDGPGIGRSDRKRVFDRFQRGSADETGAGLGLYVVDQVARAHGGRVDLETVEGHGSTFTLILPIEPPQTSRAPV